MKYGVYHDDTGAEYIIGDKYPVNGVILSGRYNGSDWGVGSTYERLERSNDWEGYERVRDATEEEIFLFLV